MTTTFPVKGPDVSFWQDNNETPQKINFEQMATKTDFVIIRAGQNSWIDQDFTDNWRLAREAGLLRGAYWFYDSRSSPEKQAELFATCLQSDLPEMEVWLDLEEHYGGPYAGYAHWKRFLKRFKELLPNVTIGIYTSYGYISTRIPPEEYAYFEKFLLWLAWYTPDINDVIIPKPWTWMLYWQFDTPAEGVEYGCESEEIDMNYFIGTEAQFRQRYQLGDKPVDPYYIVKPNVQGEYRSIRKQASPNINGTKIGQINANSSGKTTILDSVVYVADVYIDGVLKAKMGDRWLHIYEANGQPIDGWIADIHLGRNYLTIEVVDPNPQPQDKYPVYGMVRFSNGEVWESTDWTKQV